MRGIVSQLGDVPDDEDPDEYLNYDIPVDKNSGVIDGGDTQDNAGVAISLRTAKMTCDYILADEELDFLIEISMMMMIQMIRMCLQEDIERKNVVKIMIVWLNRAQEWQMFMSVLNRRMV